VALTIAILYHYGSYGINLCRPQWLEEHFDIITLASQATSCLSFPGQSLLASVEMEMNTMTLEG